MNTETSAAVPVAAACPDPRRESAWGVTLLLAAAVLVSAGSALSAAVGLLHTGVLVMMLIAVAAVFVPARPGPVAGFVGVALLALAVLGVGAAA